MNKLLFLLLCALFCVSVVAEEVNPEQEIEMIKQIQNLTRSASWEPGITSVSYYNMEERAGLCGLLATPEAQRAPKVEEVASQNLELRGFVDLRQTGKVTPVKNQGRCGSCWAFAMLGCVEYVLGGNKDLSEQHLVSCCTSSNGCNGGYIASTGRWIISNGGVTAERSYPYVSGSNGKTGGCDKSKAKGPKFNISSCSSAYGASSVKSAINKGYPVDTGMYVYQDFYHYKGGVYKHTSGNYLGGHAVVIVGYDDAKGCWILKNSWGTGWGERGFFRMAYGQCNAPWMAAYVK